MRELPSGTVTFLFTDIEGSTKLWESYPEQMRLALARHDALMREAIAASEGYVFKTIGDAFCVGFASASAALKAAVSAQLAIWQEPWPQEVTIRVRMALHSGAAECRDGDYFGQPLNRVARLLSCCHGGQTALTRAVRELIQSAPPDHVTLLDLGLHRLKGIEEPENVFQVLHPELPAEFPSLLSQTAVVNNLPAQLTSFVGREAEVHKWYEMMKDPSRRLFTITGFAGLGKTRIAMQFAVLCMHDFANGVWWCEQEMARSADEMVSLLCTQLRVPMQPSPSLLDQLVQFIRSKEMLLVLDNTEQISGAANVISRLLKDAEKVRCLVTSRRALELRGEVVLELSPLNPKEARELFEARASDCKPNFELSDDNSADVVELCRRLEGVPLAIELAASRVAGMSPRQILQRLGERFRLLQSRSPELTDRQRALRGAIDWSYDLLSDEDKSVFSQLSVFAGGFSMEDAEAVCEALDVFESVMELRRHSFLRVETDAGSQQTRFFMLDSLREYGLEKLIETGVANRSYRRHAEHFLRYAKQRLKLLRTQGEVDALKQLMANGGNLRAAMVASRELGDGMLHGELSLAYGTIRQRCGFLNDAVDIIESGIQTVESVDLADRLRANLLLERAGLHYDFSESNPARDRATESATIFRQLGDSPGLARAENLLGQADMLGRDFPSARDHYQTSLGLFEKLNDHIGMANVLNNLGITERRDRTGSAEEWDARADLAAQHLAEALRIRRSVSDTRGLAETLNNLGVLAHERAERLHALEGDHRLSEEAQWAKAWDHYRESIRYYEELHQVLGVGFSLANLGEVAENRGELHLAIRLYAAACAFLMEVKSPVLDSIQTMLLRAAKAAPFTDTDTEELQSDAGRVQDVDRVTWAFGVDYQALQV